MSQRVLKYVSNWRNTENNIVTLSKTVNVQMTNKDYYYSGESFK